MFSTVHQAPELARAGLGSHHFSSHSSGHSFGHHHYYGSGHDSGLGAVWVVLIVVVVALVLLYRNRETVRRLLASA